MTDAERDKLRQLVNELKNIAREAGGDPEVAHGEADKALLAYINDPEVTEAFDAIEKWYA